MTAAWVLWRPGLDDHRLAVHAEPVIGSEAVVVVQTLAMVGFAALLISAIREANRRRVAGIVPARRAQQRPERRTRRRIAAPVHLADTEGES